MVDLAIIGGGASGLICACTAAELARARGIGLSITIFEANERVGRKILASGNGRCNFSNANIDASLYNDPAFASQVLDAFDERFQDAWRSIDKENGVVQFFFDHGLIYREEAEGRLYPLANKSSVVLDILRSCLRELGVEERTGASVRAIIGPKDSKGRLTMHMADKSLERADMVVCATGSESIREMLSESFSALPYAERIPVLCALRTPNDEVRKLSNIRVKCMVSLLRDESLVSEERGELMFREYGVSGITVFNLSRFAQPGDVISIDFLPDVPKADLPAMLEARQRQLSQVFDGDLTCGQFMCGLLLPLVSEVVLARLNLKEDDAFDEDCIPDLASLLKSFQLEVLGPADIEHAQVMRGGLATSSFSPRTLEALSIPRLHVTGEALDVDGPCGGYNLHWAFSTGILAGMHCVDLAKYAG